MLAQILAVGFLDSILDAVLAAGYVLLFAVVFAESGLLVGFFLPGDSLLFTAGAVAAGVLEERFPEIHFNIWVLLVGFVVAAIAGDQVGYLIGQRAGPRLFNRPDSRFFRQEYVDKAELFFAKHGPRAIILARFVPVVRTFVPTVAGVSKMDYGRFVRFNVIGGFLWGAGVTLLGYFFGQIEFVQNNLEVALLGIVAVSVIPLVWEFVKHRRQRAS